MVRISLSRAVSPTDRTAIQEFLEEAHALDCAQLSDHLSSDLEHGPRPGFLAAVAHDADDGIVGYAQASAGNDGFVVDSIVWSRYPGDVDEARVALLRRLLAELPDDAAVTWWTHDDSAGALAATLGLQPGRALLRMGRSLPLPGSLAAMGDIPVRPFELGRDEQAWLEVNNAAFAWHGEQGGWDLDLVEQREQEDWFRPEGFLLHEREGRLAGFCWTKLHPPQSADQPLVGEIYVIAVHPDFHGLGLGKALTVAGLIHLQTAGATEGMLYVDAENTSAVTLYEHLGFEVSHTDQAYIRSTGGSAS